MAQVREKLKKDAEDQGLLKVVKKEPTLLSANPSPVASKAAGQAEQQQSMVIVSRYVDQQTKYDENLSAIGEYFELFKSHTDLLEDLWIQLLSILGLPNPEALCVFNKYHYECYVKNVIMSEFIKPQIDEAAVAFQKGEGSPYLENYLNKIKDIKQGLGLPQASYKDFLSQYQSAYNFNENAQKFQQQEVLQLDPSQKGKKGEPASGQQQPQQQQQ